MSYIAVRGKGDPNIEGGEYQGAMPLLYSVACAIKMSKKGLCVQCMHAGPYDDEPATIDAMHVFAAELGYAPDFSEARPHHEIYLSDPRRCAPEKLKTVICHPAKPI